MQLCVIFLHGTTHFYWDSVVWEIGMWMYPHLKDSRSHEAANYDTREHGTLHCRTLLRGTRMTTLNGLNGSLESWNHVTEWEHWEHQPAPRNPAAALVISWCCCWCWCWCCGLLCNNSWLLLATAAAHCGGAVAAAPPQWSSWRDAEDKFGAILYLHCYSLPTIPPLNFIRNCK